MTEPQILDTCRTLYNQFLSIKYDHSLEGYEKLIYQIFNMIKCDVSVYQSNTSLVFEGCLRFTTQGNGKNYYNVTGYISLKNEEALIKETFNEVVFAYYLSLGGNCYSTSIELIKNF